MHANSNKTISSFNHHEDICPSRGHEDEFNTLTKFCHKYKCVQVSWDKKNISRSLGSFRDNTTWVSHMVRCKNRVSYDVTFYLHLHNRNYLHNHCLQRTLECVSFAFSLPVTLFLARGELCPVGTRRHRDKHCQRMNKLILTRFYICQPSFHRPYPWFSRLPGINVLLLKCHK